MKRLAAFLAITFLLSACGNSDSKWTKVSFDDRVTFERPADLSDKFTPTDPTWKYGLKGTNDYPQIQVAPDMGEEGQASVVASKLTGLATLGVAGWKQRAVKDIEVDGADTAQQVDFTVERNGTTFYGSWIVMAQFPYPQSAAVSVLSQTDDPTITGHIAQTIKVDFPRSSR